jgi:hypothetical protein
MKRISVPRYGDQYVIATVMLRWPASFRVYDLLMFPITRLVAHIHQHFLIHMPATIIRPQLTARRWIR